MGSSFIRFKRFFFNSGHYLKCGISFSGGRNSVGHLTSRRKGSRLKKCYRFIDFWRRVNSVGVVLDVIRDPYRSSHIAFVFYMNGLLGYILASVGMMRTSIFFSGDAIENAFLFFKRNGEKDVYRSVFGVGSSYPLKYLPTGSFVNSIELYPGYGAQLVRAAGGAALLYKKTPLYAYLKLSSGGRALVSSDCMASIGFVSNASHFGQTNKKAGFMRNKGVRPIVRGVAKNAIDHPHGGGRGKGPQPLTPGSKLTKGRGTVSRRHRRVKLGYRFK